MLKEKRIVVVGGTSGMGLSAAQAFVANGAEVVALGLSPLPDWKSPNCIFMEGDARNKYQIHQAIELCQQKYGPMNGLFHVAGGSGRKWGDGPLHEITEEGWEQTLALNLTTLMYSNRAAVQYFLKNGISGSILNTSTVLAYAPASNFFYTHAYAAAKSGIIGFSKSIAAYYAKADIRVNVLAPALMDTPMAKRAAEREDIQLYIRSKQPLDNGRMGKAEDINGAACYFMSDASKFTTGQVLAIDGGWSISDGQFK